uniref:C2H2-type domain-containing protein n=1 Tax=Timema genevievae TaxID=629358 RepID=A0A7R9JRZ0_TIMGE|nr:unnamed protein product [Timema genevievae]
MKLYKMDPTVRLWDGNMAVPHRTNRVIKFKKYSNSSKSVPLYSCALCDMKSQRYQDILLHAQTHKNKLLSVAVILPSSDKTETCNECHQKYQAGTICSHEKRVLCERCGECFHTVGKLRNHRTKKHTRREEDTSWCCDYCGKQFTRKKSLAKHIDIHQGSNKIACDICGKVMSRSHMIRHKNIHMKKRPHKCKECGLCFHVASVLREHTYQHTGVKPYFCDICAKDFRHCSALSFVTQEDAQTWENLKIQEIYILLSLLQLTIHT